MRYGYAMGALDFLSGVIVNYIRCVNSHALALPRGGKALNLGRPRGYS